MTQTPSVNSKNYRPRLLVIDDQKINIQIMHEIFRKDYEIYMTMNSEADLTKAKELQPDLILLDIEMPKLNGYQVCEMLKKDDQLRHIPVIFVTAHFHEKSEVKGFEVGAADFIHRPFNEVITQARVRNHIGAKLQADKLRTIALLDGLTGVSNRRKFDQDLYSAFGHCARENMYLSLLMIDVDYFKRYNDFYGHQAGDQCLQAIAAAIRSLLRRSYDVVARYGGEEFACILPATDGTGAKTMAERILQSVKNLKLEHQQSDVAKVVSVSIGVATEMPQPGGSQEALIERADKLLYQAKNNGRAQICCKDFSNASDLSNDSLENS